MIYTDAYALRLDKCWVADGEAKGVVSGATGTETPVELGGGISGEVD